MQNLKIKNLP